jgi:hypothetical protein
METLNTLLSKSAQEWTDNDILQLIEALREQRQRWNLEQSAGTKNRVPATKIEVKAPKRDLAFEGLKL